MMASFSQIYVCTLSLQACNYSAIRGKGKDFFKYLHVVTAYTALRCAVFKGAGPVYLIAVVMLCEYVT